MPYSHPNGRLLIFAKAPIAGQVKTRLQSKLTAQQCAQLQQQLIEHTIHTALTANICEAELWATEINHPFITDIAQSHCLSLRQQHGADLGERMLYALQQALVAAQYAIIIGCDCPAMIANHLQHAADQLQSASTSVVIGPAEDGGYVMLASKRADPRIFQGVNWGTNTVLQQTRKNLEQAKIHYSELTTLWDVDRVEDLTRLASIASPTGKWDY